MYVLEKTCTVLVLSGQASIYIRMYLDLDFLLECLGLFDLLLFGDRERDLDLDLFRNGDLDLHLLGDRERDLEYFLDREVDLLLDTGDIDRDSLDGDIDFERLLLDGDADFFRCELDFL